MNHSTRTGLAGFNKSGRIRQTLGPGSGGVNVVASRFSALTTSSAPPGTPIGDDALSDQPPTAIPITAKGPYQMKVRGR